MRVPPVLALPLALSILLALDAGTHAAAAAPPIPAGVETLGADAWAVRLRPGTDPDAAAARVGARNLGQVALLADTWLFHVPGGDLQRAGTNQRLARSPDVLWQEQQVPRMRYPRAVPTDPLFANQWHLVHGTLGVVDANVVPAWDLGITGAGVVIAVADTGVAHTHPDLAPNYRADLSYDFNDNDTNPHDTHGHGTSAAGVATARDDGSSCGVGAAYRAGLAGLRLIDGAVTDATEAAALAYRTDAIAISSNSWGPSDNGATLEGPGPLTRAAMEQAVIEGRDGRGLIYVWAAGNGGTGDDVGADGYASMRQTIAVAGITNNGGTPWYGEHGSALLVAAPTDGGSRGISTTALGNGCTNSFGGTSSAAPLAAGVIGLMLDANPELGWRDVQHILVHTAALVNAGHAGWFDNGAGLHFNEFYGFGNIDAGAAVEMALAWEPLPDALAYESAVEPVNVAIPAVAAGLGATDSIVVDSNIASVEHVEVVFSATHQRRGDMEVTLVSPAGTEIRLLRRRSADTSGAGFSNWMFSANTFWGEAADGTWTLRVRDANAANYTGTWQNWKLNVHGTGTVDPVAAGEVSAATPFADTHVGEASAAQTITLTSTGDLDLHLVGAATLDDATHFTLAANTCTAAATLPPDATCSVVVTFTPQASGTHATTLRIATDAGEFAVELAGTGVQASGTLDGDGDFGDVRLGSASAVRYVTLHSNGSAALQLGGTPQLDDGTHFELAGGTCTATSDLGLDGSCTVGVRFAPTATGALADTLRIPTTAGEFSLVLDGMAVDPGAAISGSLAFATVDIGSEPVLRTLTVTSDGSTPLHFTAGPSFEANPHFTVAAADCSGALAPGATCTVTVAFAPHAAGPHTAWLTVPTDAGDLLVQASGTGVLPVAVFADDFEVGSD